MGSLSLLIPILVTFLLICKTNAQNAYGQGLTPGGFIKVSDSSKVQVLLDCGAKYMSVQLIFNQTIAPQFYDWIVVGTSNREECRLRGNGQLKYIIEISVMKDPCGTQMFQPGTFENVIRIGANPLIILKGDELVTVRCVYGPPEIGTPAFPVFPRTTEPYFSPVPPTAPPIGPAGPGRVGEDLTVKKAQPGIILLIVFLILFLALLFLLCGCLYFFFKRRKLRIERRKKLILAVPQGSEINKMGLGHLWWSGKSSLSNDALLNHDYMVSGNTTREGGLSVSTDYAGDTPSTSSGSPGHPQTAGSPKHPAPPGGGKQLQSGYQNQSVFVHESRHIDAHMPKHHGDDRTHAAISSHSLHAIPEERRITTTTEEITETVTTVIHEKKGGKPQTRVSPTPNQYAHPKKGKGKQKAIEASEVNARRMDSPRPPSEIYTSPKTGYPAQKTGFIGSSKSGYANPKVSHEDEGDDGSVASTLEGKPYEEEPDSRPPSIDGGATVAADIHAAGVLRDSTSAETEEKWTEEFIRIVENHRSLGGRRLTDQEINRWRHLVENDANIQEILRKSRSLEEFEAISRHKRYENLFPGDKWTIIIQALARHTFSRRLSEMIDAPREHIKMEDTPSTSDMISSGQSKRRYIKKSEASFMPRRLSPEELLDQEEKEKRIFTRESYYKVKDDLDSDQDSLKAPTMEEAVRGSTEFTEGAPMVRSSHHNDPPPPPSVTQATRHTYAGTDVTATDVYPPTLNVYVGNVPERASMRRNQAGLNTFGQHLTSNVSSIYGTSTTYDNWQMNPEEL